MKPYSLAWTIWSVVLSGTIVSKGNSATLSSSDSNAPSPIPATTTPLPWRKSFSLAIQELTALLQKMQQENKTPPQQSPSVLRYYKDCQDAYNSGHKDSTSYLIQPDELTPFEVYCQMDTSANRGWTVLQRRGDGSENFNRGWSDYEKGFGQTSGEFWLGLEKIYRLTASADNTMLQIDMRDFEGGEAVAKYGQFSLGPKTTEYKLLVGGYNGTAGDSLGEVTTFRFSTRDNDNDYSINVGVNCASQLKGGWWFYGNSCGTSNLNGDYMAGQVATKRQGIYWHYFKGDMYSLKSTRMKILRQH